MSAQTAAVLRAAKKLIDRPQKWCKGGVDGSGISGARMCAGAAIASIVKAGTNDPAFEAMSVASGHYFIAVWNDAPTTKHADVMRAFDKAIRAETRKP